MNKDKKREDAIAIGIIIAILILVFYGIAKLFSTAGEYLKNEFSKKDNTLNIISSSENEDIEDVILKYAISRGYDVNIEYAGSLDIMQKLNSGEDYDAVWLSNSIWMYMLDSNIKTLDSKCTSINPVVFGITKSKAKELGLIDKTVYTKDIVQAISDGKLKFSMSNPTSTNSGASAYLGLLSTLAGNPEVLTKETLDNEELKQKLTNLFSGMERSSGSEDFLEELFLNGDYEAVVTYESSIINIDKQLQIKGKEPLYAIYPVDGVSISDSPFAFVSNKYNDDKKEVFTDIQSYILSDEGQKLLQGKGRRTWYGGISNKIDKDIFNPEWGIDTTTYISPVKYPSTSVIKLALNLYQTELRKPTHVVFCLDYSSSMNPTGYEELLNAMDYILTDEAAKDFIQFSEKDKIDIIPFGSEIMANWTTDNGNKTTDLVNKIHNLKPAGATALYPAAVQAINKLENEDQEKYNLSVVLMTDGQGNIGKFTDLKDVYKTSKKRIPIYSIMFGSADEKQLEDIASLTNAKVFDGKTDLVKAFKEVRGYN